MRWHQWRLPERPHPAGCALHSCGAVAEFHRASRTFSSGSSSGSGIDREGTMQEGETSVYTPSVASSGDDEDFARRLARLQIDVRLLGFGERVAATDAHLELPC